MKRALAVAVVLGGFSLVAAAPASAQWGLSLAGSAVIPTSDFGDFADTGWGINAALGNSIGGSLGFAALGSYGSVSHSDVDGDKTNLIGLGGALIYRLADPTGAYPYLLGGAGLLGHQYKSDLFPDEEGTEWQGYVNAGAGLGFPLGGLRGFILGNYVYGFDDTTYFAVGAGVLIPLGG